MDAIGQAAQPNTPDPIAEVGTQAALPPQAAQKTPDQVDRTARMATIALSPIDQVMHNYEAVTAMNKQIIEASGDMSLRYKAAAMDQQESLQALSKLHQEAWRNNVQPDVEGTRAAMNAALDHQIQDRAEYALEQRTYNRIQDLSQVDPTQAAVVQTNFVKGGAEDVIRDLAIKKAIIAREVENAQMNQEDQGWMKSVVEWAAGMIPFRGDIMEGGNFENQDVVHHWYDWIFSDNRQRSEAAALYDLPADQFAKAIRNQVIPGVYKNASLFGHTDNTAALNILSHIQNTPGQLTNNTESFLNNVLPFLPISAAGRITEIPYLMVRAGARREAAASIANATLDAVREGAQAAASTGITDEEIANGLRPTALSEGPVSSINISGDSLRELAIAKAREFADQFSLRQPGRMTQDELDIQKARVADGLQQDLGKRALSDFNFVDKKLADGSTVRQIELMVGKADGGLFANERRAQLWGDANGWDGVPVQDESGGWAFKVTRDMDENGAYKQQLSPGLKNTGIAGRLTLGARQIQDDLLAAWERVSGNQKAKLIKQVVNEYSDDLRKISTQERDSVSAMLAWGERQSVWLNNDEIDSFYRMNFGRTANDAEKNAYHTMREINDIEYGIRNDVMYKNLQVKGFSTVSFQHPITGTVDRLNGLVDRDLNSAPRGRIYDTTADQHILDGTLTKEDLEQMKSEGKTIVSLEHERLLADGTTVKHYVVNKGDLIQEALRDDQLAYRPGGHRMYQEKYFVKQAVWGKQPDTGEEFLQNPNTYISGTKAEVTKWQDIMEQARQLYKGGTSAESLDHVLAPLGYMDGETFVKYMEDGTFQKNSPFTALYDRELPWEYMKPSSPTAFVNTEETGMQGWLRTNGRMYYSSKGAPLLDWKGNLAQTLDPFEVANTALMNVANLASFSDYKLSAVQRWVDTYRPYLDLDALPNKGRGLSPMAIFNDAKALSQVDQMPMQAGEAIKQKMEATRDIIRRNIGWKSDIDAHLATYQQRFEDWVMGDEPDSLRHQAGKAAADWYNDKNPLRALRGLAFDSKMGLFNLAQFPLQIQTMTATATLAGWEHATSAMINFAPMRAYLSSSGTEHMLDALVERGVWKAAGFDSAQEYKEMMREAKTSGFFDFGGTHQMVNSYGASAKGNQYSATWDRFTSAGRFFFNKGEEWNRTLAWQVAWKDTQKNFPGLTGQDFLNQVALKADDYSLNMMEQSSAAWQHGIASIPTQFWAYNARMAEAVFGKQFTNEQKLRLVLGQFFFYGSTGIPLVGSIIPDWYKARTGQTSFSPDKNALDTWEGTLDRGMFDQIMYRITGADMQFGKRIGTGNWMTDTVRSLFGSSQYGEKSWADVMGGATFGMTVQGFKTINDIVKYATAESGAKDYPLTQDAILRMASQVSTLGYGIKAAMVWNYGTWQTSQGTVMAANLPKSAAFFAALGYSPGQADRVGAMSEFLKNRKQAVEDAAKMIQNLRTQYIFQEDRREDILGEINALTRILPRDIGDAALKKVQRRMSTDQLSAVTMQMNKDKAQAELAKESADNGFSDGNP